MKIKGLLSFVALTLLALGLILPHAALAGKWAFTGSMNTPRMFHTVTRLADGRVLVAGGATQDEASDLATCELYDPATGIWTTTGSMTFGRYFHTATLLPDGKVLVAGGKHNHTFTNTAELYDPAANFGAGAWTTTGSLNVARYTHTCTLLADGKVLAAAGFGPGNWLNSCEIYDAGTWTLLTDSSLAVARNFHTATLLPNGKVLVEGGLGNSSAPLRSAEIYDAGTWSSAGLPNTAHGDVHAAVLLTNGQVLVAGGWDATRTQTNCTELYNEGTWTLAGDLNVRRVYHGGTRLAHGQVLVVGGLNTMGTPLVSTESIIRQNRPGV